MQHRSFEMGMTERDEELALFLEMRRKEKEKDTNSLGLLSKSDDSIVPLGTVLKLFCGSVLLKRVLKFC